MALFLEDSAADRELRLGEHPGHAGDLIDVYERLAVSERTLMDNAPRGKIRAAYDVDKSEAGSYQGGRDQ